MQFSGLGGLSERWVQRSALPSLHRGLWPESAISARCEKRPIQCTWPREPCLQRSPVRL